MSLMVMFFRRNGLSILGIVVLISFYILQASHLQAWLIDDAGISFSYARNLALGNGLVSQPGFSPVEGFSNPAWVFLLAFFSRAGLDIAGMVKPLSVVLITISIIVLFLAFLRLSGSKFLSLVALAGLIAQPAFIIWSVSGLENPLLVLLIVILFYICILSPTPVVAILAGIVSGLTAITRPDGILYMPIYAIYHPKYFKQTLLPSIAIWGSYFVFRLIYYGQLLPNTYLIKAEGKLLNKYWLLTMWARLKSILLGLFGPKYLAAAIIAGLFVLLVLLFWKRRIDQRYLVAAAFLFVSFGSYLLLPIDWMGEFRFASPFFPFLYFFITLMTADGISLLIKRKYGPGLAAGILLLSWLVVLYFVSYKPRLEKFAENPTVSFYGIRAGFYHFTRYSSILNLDHSSVLLPDVGGSLYYYPEVRIFDLGGLIDATIARTLGRDQAKFWDYIFDTIKPDFIHVHGGWTYTASLDDDPRFRRDYLAIFEYVDPAMVLVFGGEKYSGDYIRRSLVTTPEELAMLQAVER